MAITECPDCKKEISDSAKSCPNCGRSNIKDINALNTPTAPKKVSVLLGVGIFFVPYIFSWFTLKKGYSTLSRVVSFTWLAMVLFVVVSSDNNTNKTAPENNSQTTLSNNELSGINSETIQRKTLKWYKSLSANARKTLIEATVRDSNWGVESTNDYYNCMGDFAFNKSEELTYVEVVRWCKQEQENNPERFKSHFNELDAKDLSSEAAVMCQNVVENQLKSPATADFPWLDRSIYKKGEWRYVVKSYVDSQNSFGATTRTNWHCDIQYKGEGEPLNGSSWTLHTLEFQ